MDLVISLAFARAAIWNSESEISTTILPILKSASEAAAEILSLDPDLSLEQHRALKHYLLKRQENASDGLGL